MSCYAYSGRFFDEQWPSLNIAWRTDFTLSVVVSSNHVVLSMAVNRRKLPVVVCVVSSLLRKKWDSLTVV